MRLFAILYCEKHREKHNKHKLNKYIKIEKRFFFYWKIQNVRFLIFSFLIIQWWTLFLICETYQSLFQEKWSVKKIVITLILARQSWPLRNISISFCRRLCFAIFLRYTRDLAPLLDSICPREPFRNRNHAQPAFRSSGDPICQYLCKSTAECYRPRVNQADDAEPVPETRIHNANADDAYNAR